VNNRVRVGDTIYDENKRIVALFTHGAWYEEKKKGDHLELVPLDFDKAMECDRMPDALKLTMSAGEMQIINKAEGIMQAMRESSRSRNLVTDAVKRGVARGLSKFGPFDPKTESRDLDKKISKCLRSAMVYSCMQMLVLGDSPRSGTVKSVFIDCAMAWLRMG